ncbi:MAG: preprotein translocase subunit SecE, partial [Anaerovoracaceae bacterium]
NNKEKSAAKKAYNKAKQNAQKKNNQTNSKGFWKEVKLEMSKVIWPTRNELISYTIVVIVVCAAFAIGFQLIDMGVLALLKKALGITLA